jgi:pilus assembly protein CpaE
VPESTILILTTETAAPAIGPILTHVGYGVTSTGRADDALAALVDAQLAIIDIGDGLVDGRSALDICRAVRATPAVANIPVLCVAATDDVEERIRFLEAGADDVIARPFDTREVEARVEALLLRFSRSLNSGAIATDGGLVLRPNRTIAVFSPKGGVGTTTVAVNIAVAAAQRRPDRICLVDLDLQFGTVASSLDLKVGTTIADAVRDEVALREPEILRTYALRHDSGLHVIPAPLTPADHERVTPDHVDQLLRSLLEVYESVVVDAGSTLDERVLHVFDLAESIILPVYPEIPALKAVHALLDFLSDTGEVGDRYTFVLNNMFAREILKLRDIEAALGTRISLDIPYDPFVYLKATNEGVPVVVGAPRSPAADRLNELSRRAFGLDALNVPAPVEPRKRGLFGLGRG